MSGLVDASAAPQADRTVEVCIVGSGCGGATAAWELAQAGKEVLVLEEGGDYTGPRLTQRDGAMYDQLYMDRGGRMTKDRSIAILQGRVVGGGGVINASDVVPLSDEVLRHWQTKFGLTDFSPQALDDARAQALTDLSANVPTEGQVNLNNRLLRKGAEALGWKGELMHHNRVDCAGVGACLIGCPLDRKKNPRFVALPSAMTAGATVLSRARVVRIEGGDQELKTLQCRRLDAKGYRELDGFTVRAKVVILAANAVGSAALLLRSGLGNANVGAQVSLQPQLPVTARFDEEVRFHRGIPQSFAVTEFEKKVDPERGLWGFRLEAIAGTPGIVGSLLPQLGALGQRRMKDYTHQAACLVLMPDLPHGRIRVEANGRLHVDYALDDEQRARAREGAKAAARAYLAAGAREVFVPVAPPICITSEKDLARLDAFPFDSATAPFLSAHQQGTVRFSGNEKDGGARPDGLVFGTRGVYVFDSSGFPSSASSHTMAPILAVSRFLSKKLLSHWP